MRWGPIAALLIAGALLATSVGAKEEPHFDFRKRVRLVVNHPKEELPKLAAFLKESGGEILSEDEWTYSDVDGSRPLASLSRLVSPSGLREEEVGTVEIAEQFVRVGYKVVGASRVKEVWLRSELLGQSHKQVSTSGGEVALTGPRIDGERHEGSFVLDLGRTQRYPSREHESFKDGVVVKEKALDRMRQELTRFDMPPSTVFEHKELIRKHSTVDLAVEIRFDSPSVERFLNVLLIAFSGLQDHDVELRYASLGERRGDTPKEAKRHAVIVLDVSRGY